MVNVCNLLLRWPAGICHVILAGLELNETAAALCMVRGAPAQWRRHCDPLLLTMVLVPFWLWFCPIFIRRKEAGGALSVL